MKLFPTSAIQQLEFDKIQILLAGHCRTEFARHKAEILRIHTRREFIGPELSQTHEYKLLFLNHLHFPDDAIFNLSKELKLLSIEGSVLTGNQFLSIKKLSSSVNASLRIGRNIPFASPIAISISLTLLTIIPILKEVEEEVNKRLILL